MGHKQSETVLTKSEREQIATILERRANDIADYKGKLAREKDVPSVDYALELEITRLRRLASRVNPPAPEDDERG